MFRITKRVVIKAELSIKNNFPKEKVETIFPKVPNSYPMKKKRFSY
jgi:hypothetical protein